MIYQIRYTVPVGEYRNKVMSILDPVADLLGVSPTFIVIAVLAFAVLVLGWYALKALLKLTWRIFAVGLSLLIAVALLFGLVLFIAEAL